MTCARCQGTGRRREWLVAGRIGLAYIERPALLKCWRCRGRGEIR